MIVLFLVTVLILIIILWQYHRKITVLGKCVEKLEQSNAIKDRLFSIIGHDLNNTISSIPPTIEIFRQETTSIEEKAFILDSIEENTIAVVETLESLLNWGKSQIKGVVLHQTYFNATDIIHNKLKLVGIAAKNKQITIINNLPAETKIYADINHFKFIIRNLLSNAIKFSKFNSIVEINADKYHQPEFVVFSVKDDGTGIDKERHQHIFDPFNLSTAGTANEMGSSIGLMICKEYVTANGGKIWVESEKDKGAIFYFSMKTFPYNKPLLRQTISPKY